MKVVLRKSGNCTILVLPPVVLKALRLRAGQTLTLATTGQGTLTLERGRRPSLAELIAACDSSAPPPADLELWDTAKPRGQEIF